MKFTEMMTKIGCSRCGGSGHYSYCPGYGSTCFKCHGVGTVFTKKASATIESFEAALKVPVSEVKVGDRVYETAMVGISGQVSSRWERVLEIGSLPMTITTNGVKKEVISTVLIYAKSRTTTFSDSTVRVAASAEKKINILKELLEKDKKNRVHKAFTNVGAEYVKEYKVS